MTHLYLIRHGQAVVNVEPIIGGMRGDRGLTPLGIEQAQRLRTRLAATGEIRADMLIASTMPRARETAAIIAPALDLEPIHDPEVQELNPGEADGLTFDEFRQRYGELRFNPQRPLSPGGESWPMFQQRISAAIERIISDHANKTIVVVCHGWVIEASFMHFLDLGALDRPKLRFQVANTSLTHWERFEHRQGWHWRLAGYNDAVHLHAAVRWEAPPDADSPSHPGVPISADDTENTQQW